MNAFQSLVITAPDQTYLKAKNECLAEKKFEICEIISLKELNSVWF